MDNCPVCQSNKIKSIYASNNNTLARYGFLESDNDPSSHDSNLNIKLSYCENCNFCWNDAFDYSLVNYSSDKIIEAGNFSKRYYEYQIQSAKDILNIIGHVPDEVVEIGAGSGIFINAIDAKRKIAIEPSEESKNIGSNIEVYNHYFEKSKFNFPAELIVMRQVLEHIEDPANFLRDVLESFESDKNYLYIEVPNSYPSFSKGRFYDFYYEHCNYFTAKSLIKLASELSMNIVSMNTAMDGELISILMTSENFEADDICNLLNKVETKFNTAITNQINNNKVIVGWGASGNGVQILNRFNLGVDKIPVLIDSDVNKQGLYIPGTLQKIVSPDEAKKYNPDTVIVFTQFHKKEIEEQCRTIFGDIEVIQI